MAVRLDQKWRNDTRLQFFLRHVVPIFLRFEKGRENIDQFYTAFLFAVHGQWLLFTAGHIITEVAKARAHGYTLRAGRLLDSLGMNARFKDHPVPFDYDESEPQALSANPTWDYGLLFIADNTRRLLGANGVEPFEEAAWAMPPPKEQVAEYQLVGLPVEGTEQTGPENFTLMPTMLRVIEEPEAPDGFPKTEAPMFYGRLAANPFDRLLGFSGSPILAFSRPDPEGRARYWLHAMQVSQLRGTSYISGMLMEPLGRYLREIVEGKHRAPEEGAPGS